jgi:AraC-like DNA-binding protein
MRAQHLTANNRLLWPVVEMLRHVDCDLPAVLASVGLDEDAIYHPSGRVPLEQHHALWRRAVEITGDGALGIHLAGFTQPDSTVSWPLPLSLFEHMGMVSASLADAITVQSRFARLMRDGVTTAIEIDGDEAIFRMEFQADEPAALVEYNFAVLLNLGRRITKRDLTPKEVWFTHAPPAHPQAHAQLFKAPIRWNAPFNGIIAAASDYTAPLPTTNEQLRTRIIQQAERMLSALPSVDLFEDKVCVQIEAELPDGNTNAAAVAEKLGVSCRTLHRRLQQEGTSYQDLLDRVRFRLAVRYLGSGKSIGDVAVLVGFAQASTFHRAFKNWTGETPAEYQDRQRAAATPRFHPPAQQQQGTGMEAGGLH